ncbi:MAG: efflux RND transporter permease subunit [Candidatus Moraniibacteriota bacterium]
MSLTRAFFERLHFEKELAETAVGRYLSKIRLVILITATLAAAGLAAFLSLPKDLNPAIQIPTVIITVAYPGASSEDVESLVAIPVEEAVTGISHVAKVNSTSSEGFSMTIVEFDSSVRPRDAESDVQNALNQVNDLPQEAERPTVAVIDFQDQPVITFVIAHPDAAALPRLSDILEDQLKSVPGTEKVNVAYRTPSEISVLLNPETIAERHIDWMAINQSLRAALENYPAGTLSSGDNLFALSQEKKVATLDDLRALPLQVNGETLTLGSIARVEETPLRGENEALFSLKNEEYSLRGISFAVFKTSDADTQATVQGVNDAVAKLQKEYPELIYAPFFDGSHEIQKSYNQLFRDFLVTLSLVFINLFLFFGLRQSIITALAIPFSFLGTFLVMGFAGISVSFIALFALLLALGILVDNAIVVISAFTNYYRSGKYTPYETVLLVFRDFHTVIFTTTLTTIWAFLPLLLATGIIGDFIKPIPIVVSSALAISAGAALFLVLPFMAVFLEGHFPPRILLIGKLGGTLLVAITAFFLIPAGPFKIAFWIIALILVFLLMRLVTSFFKTITSIQTLPWMEKWHEFKDHGVFSFDTISAKYAALLERILGSKRARRMTLSFLIVFMVFAYSLFPLGYVVNEFFPGDDLDTIYVSIDLTPGAAPERGYAVIERLLPEIKKVSEVEYIQAEVGASPPTDGIVSASSGKDAHHVLLTVKLADPKVRDRTSDEISRSIEHDLSWWNEGKISVVQLSGGPPAGADLQLTLLGKDLSSLQDLAGKVERHLSETQGINNISISITPGTGKVVFQPNVTEIEKRGLTLTDSANLLRFLGSGITIKKDMRFGDEKHDVLLRLDEKNYSSPEAMGALPVVGHDGSITPLLGLGKFTLEQNPTAITREDEKRSISISAGVLPGYSVSTLNKELEKYAATDLGLPEGYDWKTGGVNEENNKSVRSILLAMLLSAALILGTMTIQFNSFRKAIIVLLVVPLAVSGVFVLFAIFGIPLSFPALIGVLALFGIVVNNSIIMVDKINRNMELGLPLKESIIEGASSRLEPIVLTAITTIIGLIPITLSDPIWQGLGGAIIAGLTFSGVAKLFFIPVVYWAWFAKEEEAREKTASHPPLEGTLTTEKAPLFQREPW